VSETAVLEPILIETMQEFGVEGRRHEAEAQLGSKALYLGETVINGQRGPTWRAYSGPESIADPAEGEAGRGGWRIHMYDGNHATGEKGVITLSTSMRKKFALQGLPYRGAKALTMLDVTGWGLDEKKSAARQLMTLMHNYEEGPLDNHLIDGIAGDLGTNNPRIMDAAVDQVAAQNPGYDYAWALATGTSLDHGGNEFRPEATGFGLFVSLRERLRQKGMDEADLTIQGMGAVGIWLAHHAVFSHRDGNPKINVRAMDDRDGMVYTEGKEGLIVPFEIAKKMGDAAFQAPKAAYFHGYSDGQGLRTTYRAAIPGDTKNILTFPTDYVAPCALPGTINIKSVVALGAREGSLGGANNDTTQEAYEWNCEFRPGFDEITGEVANSEGTHVSHIERTGKIATVDAGGKNMMPNREQTMAQSEASMTALMDRRERMGKELNTTDGRKMAAGLIVANLFPGVVSLDDTILAAKIQEAA